MKEKLLGISLEESGNYSGNGLKTTRLREIGHPLIFVCVCSRFPPLCFIFFFISSKVKYVPPSPKTVARAAVIRQVFRPRVGQYTKCSFHPHTDENESEGTCYYKCPRETQRRNLKAISYFRFVICSTAEFDVVCTVRHPTICI